MENRIIRIISAILSIITLISIFCFSNQNGETSEGLSRLISGKIVEIINSGETLTETEKEEKISNVDAVIRKLAHFSIYTLLGIFLMIFVSTSSNLKTKGKISVVVVIGLIYAMSDEFHQSFISDRTPLFTDVIIDTMGIIFGLLIILFLQHVTKKT